MNAESTNTLLRMLRPEEDFETGAKYLSSFFRRTEEHWDAGDVLEGLFASDTSPRLIEYALFCFFHIGRADIDTAASVMKMRRLTVLLLRALRAPYLLSEREHAIVERMRAEAGLRDMAHFYQLCGGAVRMIDALFARQPVHPQYCQLLALLIECEADALAQRLNWVSDKIDPYDLKMMSKILPLVTIYEERARSYKLLAAAIKKGEEVGRAILSFEYFMKTDDFAKWMKRIDKKEGLRQFHDALTNQQRKKIPTRALVGVSSITRCLLGDIHESAPLDWIASALGTCERPNFTIDCGNKAALIGELLAGSTIRLNGTSVQGDYRLEAFAALTGTDMLTTPLKKPEPDPYDLVCRAINNDSILMRLLDNPKVHSRPGLVEYVVRVSRSTAVLTKIASGREFYTGTANAGVPTALLRCPCTIPMTLLRGFVSPKYVSIQDLREIEKAGHTVRREVLNEVESYMKRRK
jgi:hypothetical protein